MTIILCQQAKLVLKLSQLIIWSR